MVDFEVDDDVNSEELLNSADMEGRKGDEDGIVGCSIEGNEHDKVRELSQQLATEKRRSATYKRHLEMIFEHIEEHNQSLSKKIQEIVNNVNEIESNEIETRR
ncbi:hypothetical protein Ccrd_021285 [Cynara cardunculus var. scolymus]|uniref:Uncharacterized protein n=1 Tax=Cynara cardunculus var. scolymus TaxID=59895 RepID=A0A103Y0V7_CYNCS|nr:hypothetical protein Ccrd_021285 [Cynara cardunculus var. scolymus]